MIQVRHLTKRYGALTAIDDLNFTVEAGKIYGFLGPNGAGKSTTMNIITGCLAATEGTVTIDGHDIYDDPIAAKRCIGYLPEIPPLYPEMTVYDYLRFVAQAKKVPAATLPAHLAAIMKKTAIDDVQGRLIKHLSKGYRQRVGIAQAIVGDAPVIILDEPTIGLDPKQIIEIRDLIRTLGRTHTVFLSSHILQEISALCDVLLILSHGKLIATGTPEELAMQAKSAQTLTLLVKGTPGSARAALEDLAHARVQEAKATQEAGVTRVILACEGEGTIREAVFHRLSHAGLPILDMQTRPVNLEDVFLELTAPSHNDAKEDE